MADPAQGATAQEPTFHRISAGVVVDARDPAGIHFGTNSGSVFACLDEGESWTEIARRLPTTLSVEVQDRT